MKSLLKAKRITVVIALAVCIFAGAVSNSQTAPVARAETLEATPKQVKFLSLSFIPVTSDSPDAMLDTTVVNNNWGEYNMTLAQVREKILANEAGAEQGLENGTCYKGYQDTGCTNYIDYVQVDAREFLTPTPQSTRLEPYGSGTYVTDYYKIMSDNSVCDFVDNQGVYEFWIWSYTGITRKGWESNFSSNIYGDISNSDQYEADLPDCGHSYTVYEYNYGRGVAEAIHNHGHQFERIFGYVDYELFWNKFVGYYPGGSNPVGLRRCGWVHFAPNSTTDYDYANMTNVDSDCLDWDPTSNGQISSINCNMWNCDHEEFLVFWMQNFPTANNGLKYRNEDVRNWWNFIVDFDAAVEVERSLTLTPPPLPGSVYRFWSDSKQSHFYTISVWERNNIISNDKSWTYEGVAYQAYELSQCTGKTKVYRFWSDSKQKHFYTIFTWERDNVINNDRSWKYEGSVFCVDSSPKTGNKAVHRFWSDSKQGHFYTAEEWEKNNVINNDKSWKYEGVAFHVIK